jgi:hypothetical protein
MVAQLRQLASAEWASRPDKNIQSVPKKLLLAIMLSFRKQLA